MQTLRLSSHFLTSSVVHVFAVLLLHAELDARIKARSVVTDAIVRLERSEGNAITRDSPHPTGMYRGRTQVIVGSGATHRAVDEACASVTRPSASTTTAVTSKGPAANG